MTKIEATFEVVTPMFCGDGENTVSASLRPLSIKGLLRFHFRAVAFRLLKGDLQKILNFESKIFGSTKGIGLLRIRTELLNEGKAVSANSVLNLASGKVVGEGVRYLGYGLMGAFGANEGRLTRPCLDGVEFSLHLTLREDDKTCITLLHYTMLSIAICGSLGARSRKGFGSLSLKSLKIADKEEKVEQVFKWPALLAKEFENQLSYPDYTAWSSQSRVIKVEGGSSALEIMNTIGKAMMHYRSFGRDGQVLGVPALKKFQVDHDLMHSAHDSKVEDIPRRSAFGLPHKYFFTSIQNCSRDFGAKPENHERRASPLFIKVIKVDGQYFGLLSFLPAQFLPDGERIVVHNRARIQGGKSTGNLSQFYTPVSQFLEFIGSGESEFTRGYTVRAL
ncbi:MAG: type III-B CRISPR module RAMP protein Cmr1 [Candidatus Cloacimonetes bacterium]|nr:type III-B CRISPR module RAMP protein Cmr1 [Candidatus Cloacimonadota bacterium]